MNTPCPNHLALPNPVAEFDAYILEGGFPKALEYDSLQLSYLSTCESKNLRRTENAHSRDSQVRNSASICGSKHLTFMKS